MPAWLKPLDEILPLAGGAVAEHLAELRDDGPLVVDRRRHRVDRVGVEARRQHLTAAIEDVAALGRRLDRPHLLTQWLFETANAFSQFFDRCSVQNAETESLQRSRLVLCDLMARAIRTGLGLLGIDVAEVL